MRIAKTLDDLPIGTPIEINGAYKIHKGIVCRVRRAAEPEVVVLFSDGTELTYYEEDLITEQIQILETKCKEQKQ